MKWLTPLLSLYLLGLSLWPCADDAFPLTGQVQATMLTADASSHSNSSHEHDACTPFCTCACCSATLISLPHFSYSLTPSVEMVPVPAATFYYSQLQWAEPLSAIWQPPKLRV